MQDKYIVYFISRTKKENDEKNKRITYIALTEKGKQLESNFNAISNEVYKTAYKNFSEKRRKYF